MGGLLLTAALPGSSEARVVRFVIEERVPFAPGTEWGTAGQYERLTGTAYFEVDPRDPLNGIVINLDKAPKNARGMVEYSSPFLMLKPVDMARGNRKIWYAINNRGSCTEVGLRAFPFPEATCAPLTAADVGANNVLLQQGYVTVDAGWHGDGLQNRNRLFPKFPIATQHDGSPIVGPLRREYQTETNIFSQSLVGQPGWRAYEAADTATAHSTLSVRERAHAPNVIIPADRWAFGRCPTGPESFVPTTTDICMFDGFVAFKIYELVYPAKNPIVMGLAHAVTRDLGSFLRYQTHDDAGSPNPLVVNAETEGRERGRRRGRDGHGDGNGTGIRRMYASGTSSTGMYLREFLYLGFNEDEAHRKVFDAVTVYSAATQRLFANVQFAHPTFYSGQDQHHDYTSNAIAPFTYAVTTDPLTGVRDGLLKRPKTDPLVLQIDEELVFWQWKASLNVADSGGHSIRVPRGVRLYFQNGFGHVGASGLLAPSRVTRMCENNSQGLAAISVTPRALVQVIDAWADRGVEPPKSNYPRLDTNTLVSLSTYRASFPSIPNVQPPRVNNEAEVLNFGTDFGSHGGVQTVLPPVHGPRYNILVPRPDDDGTGMAGIETMWTRAPIGTNVGWNVRAGFREPDLCGLNGSFIPFSRTKAERLANGDSRKSLEERYRTHDGFVKAVEKAAKELVRERFLLEEDAKIFIRAAQESDVLR